MSDWTQVEPGERVPAEVCEEAEGQATCRYEQALCGLEQPLRMLGAIFAFTIDRGFLLAEVELAELREVANLRPSRAVAALDRLVAAGIIVALRHDDRPCCVVVGVPPLGFYWWDERHRPPANAESLDLAADLLSHVIEAKR